ncbi:MAG: lantibiotic dehydratase [Bacteroidota bacterium]
MDLFPHSLIRLGGGSFENWNQFDFTESRALLESIQSLKTEISNWKNTLSESLHTYIMNVSDSGEQNALQNIRRDLYNDRKIKPGKLKKALELLSPELGEELNQYLAKRQSYQDLVASGQEVFDKECATNRETFKKLASEESLQKGLVLSSRSLLDRTNDYIKRDVEKFRNKELKTEQSIIKYLTRMYTKTSPFSTFTNLAMASFSDLEGPALQVQHKTETQVSSHIRLNNYLFKYLSDLLKCYREAYLQFHIRPNPTIEKYEDHFLFLTNNNNIESFQRIPMNPVVDYILGIVSQEKEGIVFSALVAELMEGIDAEESELESYVKQLIDYGFLEYHVGVSGVDPDWDIKLVQQLEPLKQKGVPHISELINVLKQMRELGNTYAQGGLEERKALLVQAYDTFRDMCMKIHEAAGLPEDERKTEEERLAAWKAEQEAKKKEQEKEKEKQAEEGSEAKEQEEQKEEGNSDQQETFKHMALTLFNFKPEQIFYEDTTREVEAKMDSDTFTSILTKINDLLYDLYHLKGMEEEKLKMRHYFLEKYGESGQANLLTFYEDYFRDFKKPEKEREEQQRKEAELKAQEKAKDQEKEQSEGEASAEEEKPTETTTGAQIPEVEAQRESLKSWGKAAEKHFKNAINRVNGQVDLERKDVLTINEAYGLEKSSEQVKLSLGSFIQFYLDENNEVKAVLNGTFAGYGKMLSRFLHIFDQKITQNVREWNVSLSNENEILIEDCDGSYFNANLHPTLMPYEIWMPGGHNTLPVESQLPITDFMISYNKAENKLNLFHQNMGKRAFVFDLGFQSLMGRSQLFQLLEKFTSAAYVSHMSLVSNLNQSFSEDESEAQSKPKVISYPRVVYENDIILQRKSWYIPKPLIPIKEPMENDWQYFVKLNLWRKEHGIPDEVFIFINPNRMLKPSPAQREAAKKLTRDDYKPQYVDFNNPLVVGLFERSVLKVPNVLKIEEMLPHSGQMLKIDNERFVSEFVVQWYNRNN